MAQTEDKFRKQLEVVKLKLDEIVEILASGNTENISGTYEQIGELIKRLEKLKCTTADYMMDSDRDLEYIKQWTTDHKEDNTILYNSLLTLPWWGFSVAMRLKKLIKIREVVNNSIKRKECGEQSNINIPI